MLWLGSPARTRRRRILRSGNGQSLAMGGLRGRPRGPLCIWGLSHVAWGLVRDGNGLAGSRRVQATLCRAGRQSIGCLGRGGAGWGRGSRCMGFFVAGAMIASSKRVRAALDVIAGSARSTNKCSRSGVCLSRKAGIPWHCRIGAPRLSTVIPALTTALRMEPCRRIAAILPANARISAVRRPWVVRAAAMRARPAAEGPVLAPPCMRQRPFPIAGARQAQPARVFAPHRGAAFGLPRGLPLRRAPLGFSRCRGFCVGTAQLVAAGWVCMGCSLRMRGDFDAGKGRILEPPMLGGVAPVAPRVRTPERRSGRWHGQMRARADPVAVSHARPVARRCRSAIAVAFARTADWRWASA